MSQEAMFMADEEDNSSQADTGKVANSKDIWKIIIVDDNEETHAITEMVLSDYRFEGKRLKFYNAYSAADARNMVKRHQDAALILLDVVMEDEDSGFEVIEYIRNTLKNKLIQIILRTAMPGKAPAEKIIMEYEINDYKEKTEFTAQKLFMSVTSALRSFRNIRAIENNKTGLQQIIKSTSSMFQSESLEQFAQGIITQLLSILGLDESAIYVQALSNNKGEDYQILASTGQFSKTSDIRTFQALSKDVVGPILEVFAREKSLIIGDSSYIYISPSPGIKHLLYFTGAAHLNESDKNLIRIFSTNVTVAFSNIQFFQDLVSSQKEIIHRLNEVVEYRTHNSVNHIQRISEYCKLLALKNGCSEEESKVVMLASQTHDIGKIGIPHELLKKRGSLTNDEFKTVQKHSTLGYEILNQTEQKFVSKAAIVAFQHHEQWNGEGYPQQIKGQNIHLYSRITQLADVFENLSQDRVYNCAWEMDRIVEYIAGEKGNAFDPDLSAILLNNIDCFLKIKDRYDLRQPKAIVT